MTKEELSSAARREGSEYGPLGMWPRARLIQSPQAGELVQVDGNWYVAVAGRRREGTKGTIGGLYARWVRVPEEIYQNW